MIELLYTALVTAVEINCFFSRDNGLNLFDFRDLGNGGGRTFLNHIDFFVLNGRDRPGKRMAGFSLTKGGFSLDSGCSSTSIQC